ncbi:hypothetical protein AGMMS49944_32040 [Spirochaetia bacterium]|nr:hypothetical protein AGMMS49944_32040 [Spirochaetia bacterium]
MPGIPITRIPGKKEDPAAACAGKNGRAATSPVEIGFSVRFNKNETPGAGPRGKTQDRNGDTRGLFRIMPGSLLIYGRKQDLSIGGIAA